MNFHWKNSSIFSHGIFSLCLLLLLQVPLKLKAQLGLLQVTHPELITGQSLQPAMQNQLVSGSWAVGFSGYYDQASRPFALGELPLSDNILDAGEKDQILASMGENNRFNQHSGLGMVVATKRGKHAFSFHYQSRQGAYLGFQNPASLGLILKGNAAYAGQTVTETEMELQTANWQNFGLSHGMALSSGFQFGYTLKFIQGQNLSRLGPSNFSLTTSDLGEEIQFRGDYDAFTARTSVGSSWGLGVDVGLAFEAGQQWRVEVAMQNLGFITWQGNRNAHQFDLTYEGVWLSNLGQINNGGAEALFPTDSLRALIIPDTQQTSLELPIDPRLRMAFRYSLGERQEIHAVIHYGFTRSGPGGNGPMAGLVYTAEVSPVLKLGALLSLGGVENWGFGLSAVGNVTVGEQIIRPYLQADNLVGFIVPTLGQASRVNAGLTWQLK
ncbi:MAG: DUF5723 family protein [Bacteroidota bacterium]